MPVARVAVVVASSRKLTSHPCTAAKSALRRKKVHEKSLETTNAQIAQIEQQIYSIEAANINQETLNAMKNAGKAMKQIHQGLTIDKVDQTMCVDQISMRVVEDSTGLTLLLHLQGRIARTTRSRRRNRQRHHERAHRRACRRGRLGG